MNPLTSQSILYFASRSLCTTEAWVTTKWTMKFVYKVGSTIFYKNICWGFAIILSVTKADLPANVAFFLYRIPHPFSCARVVGILFLQLSGNDTIAQGVDRHTTVNCEMLREVYFDWLQSGFYDDNKRSATKWDENWERTEVIKINGSRFFNVLKFWQLANQGWDLHLTRKMIMH